ncbi:MULTISPECIES: PAS and helix-turn-helix domain-containing protein [Rhizobium]|uniref:PAS and helix-turn-helix domain-containing protein n=1 Tax=Rhizobium leguminosarum bv. viciae TaxID=387 RepID=A0A8G2MP92_RHILV|nr:MULTISPECIES: PAS and helix-turn-helix domain-containing protein [Rhizobium]MBC2807098.1 PAS and helix-turn-helix domain-containing protein [Rhizobium ruizarguesonis]MBY5473349.1 PAS and helix-turn-helix domain-containing protein [Rhizobium leguminosarum]MBY5878486.1 PAS and helix-turn-helix domain-containing protein [Rhizobium leguminosarum]MCB2402377.1 PAS and helix-turn-helix domain-containing protein [Rhizobium ruizarguesonis]NEI02878.1 PAS domain-containing protein [Rhizobium leguminos
MRFTISDMPVPMAYATHRIIRDCNEAFADLFERKRDEIIDRSFARLYPRVSDFVRIGEMWGVHLSGSRRYYDERIMKTAGGRRFWCAVNGRSRTPDNPFAEAVYCFQPMIRPVDDGQSILSERRRQILSLVSQGKTNVEIALELALSRRTVEAHRARVMRKVGVRNTAELIAWFSKQPPLLNDASWEDGAASPGRVPFLV